MTDISGANKGVKYPTSRIILEVSPEIEEFLRECNGTGTGSIKSNRIDLDELEQLVFHHNKNHGMSPRSLRDLVETTRVVERRPADLRPFFSQLSETEIMRLRAEEKKYSKSVESIGFIKAIRDVAQGKTKDMMADYRLTLALGVNVSLGLFLSFGAGYWMALYCGVNHLPTRLIAGLIFSFISMLVEMILYITREEKLAIRRARKLRNSQPPFPVPKGNQDSSQANKRPEETGDAKKEPQEEEREPQKKENIQKGKSETPTVHCDEVLERKKNHDQETLRQRG